MNECVHNFQPIKDIPSHLSGGPTKCCRKCGMLAIPDGVADETRRIVKEIVDIVTSSDNQDPNAAVTATCLATHFLLQSVNYSHDSFCEQLMRLKERDNS